MLPWGGISCCLSAAALYLLGRSSGRDAEVLKSVARVNQLKELAKLLDIESKVLPLVVAISGRVGSETPINCEYSGLRGVIVEETAEQHFLKHNDSGSWIQDSALMLSMSKEVPWYLDDGTDRVYVVGARGASGFVLTVGSEIFEESGRSLVRGTLDYLQGLKMLGVKRIERVLPTGTSLTVVGEMATKLTLILSTVFFTSILLHLPTMTMSDDTCPYPCYPPPTGTGTGTGTTPPPPASQTGSYPPPGNYPTPTGNFPYYPSPPSGNNYYGPPPPDPILPYFPFYYRKPPHKTEVSSAPSSVPRSRLILIATACTFLLGFSLIL